MSYWELLSITHAVPTRFQVLKEFSVLVQQKCTRLFQEYNYQVFFFKSQLRYLCGETQAQGHSISWEQQVWF